MPNEETQVLGMPDVNTEANKMPEKPKDKPKDTEAENELLERMMYAPTSSGADSTLSLDSTSEVEDEEREKAKDLLKILEKDSKTSEKYQKQLLDKALEDPTSVMTNTPRGWMTVREAIQEGFNLATGEFDQEPIPGPDWDAELSKLSPREQQTIRNLTRRDARQANPAPQNSAVVGEQPMPLEGEAADMAAPIEETQIPGAEEGTPIAL